MSTSFIRYSKYVIEATIATTIAALFDMIFKTLFTVRPIKPLEEIHLLLLRVSKRLITFLYVSRFPRLPFEKYIKLNLALIITPVGITIDFHIDVAFFRSHQPGSV